MEDFETVGIARQDPNKEIDPQKLNEVLQDVLGRIISLQESKKSASPEFEVLMNNYLGKANEAERNQARFEEALERLEITEKERKKFSAEKEDLEKRVKQLEEEYKALYKNQEEEVDQLKKELSTVTSEKSELENNLATKHQENLMALKQTYEKKLKEIREEARELIESKNKLEGKVKDKESLAEAFEKELSSMKVKLADEQAKIREEIIEATRYSGEIEQKFQEERSQLLKTIRELKSALENLKSDYLLKKREAEYKEALLQQAMKGNSSAITKVSNIATNPISEDRSAPDLESISEISSGLKASPSSEEGNKTANSSEKEEQKKNKNIGGIWSRLSLGNT